VLKNSVHKIVRLMQDYIHRKHIARRCPVCGERLIVLDSNIKGVLEIEKCPKDPKHHYKQIKAPMKRG